jgi:hypothetical protein
MIHSAKIAAVIRKHPVKFRLLNDIPELYFNLFSMRFSDIVTKAHLQIGGNHKLIYNFITSFFNVADDTVPGVSLFIGKIKIIGPSSEKVSGKIYCDLPIIIYISIHYGHNFLQNVKTL